MQICKVKNYQELSRKAANLIAAQIILKPDSVLGLATGSSPVGTYEHLVEMYENGDLDFSQVTTVNLDEYKGLAGSDEQSYRYFMNTHLFHKININHANTYVPNGTEPDAEKACQAYNELLHKIGPADIQILGLGHDGHIGFNEPSDHFENETHCVDLTETTIQANKRFFDSEKDVPKQAYTMGIGTIISKLLSMTGMTFPIYIGAMIAAAFMRNIGEYSGQFTIYMGEINDIGGISLSLFLGIAMITLKLWQLADLALPLITLLAGQTILMFLFTYFVIFNIMGRDYDAAVLSSGVCGFGMGATPNAMANMQAICERYVPSVKAYLLVPLIGSLFADFLNSLVITFFINFL